MSNQTPVTQLIEALSKPAQIRSMAEEVISKHRYICYPDHEVADCPRCVEAKTRIDQAEAVIQTTVHKWVEDNPL